MHENPFTLYGRSERQGTYLLLVRLARPICVSFGRFLNGKPLQLEAGSYLYLGSALGKGTSTFPLARRLLRHTSRTIGKEPHAIRESLRDLLLQNNLMAKQAPDSSQKRLHWHIDYLLDRPEASIVHIVIIRSATRLEPVLARYLQSSPETSVPAERLGAQDTSHDTHLLHCSDPQTLLERLGRKLSLLMQEE